MRAFRVELGRDAHPVHVGAGILDRVGELSRDAGIKPGRAALISDSNVAKIYGGRVEASLEAVGFEPFIIEIPAGEGSKSLEMLATVYDRMTEAELDRQSVVFALGGGVTGDLGAFAAATYLRGIAVVQIPTTIVAQVDSALGGKSGVNHRLGKNLIGAFHQPKMVLADVESLKSLPEREFREGLAEVIKYGAIMDAPMIADLERDLDAILRRDIATLEWMVDRSLKHKAYVVENDEREGGLRKILNFGHTIGHAIEASAGYGEYLHGEAVAIGMVAACAMSRKFAGLAESESVRLVELIRRAGLPISMREQSRTEDFTRALRLDKKRVDKQVEFVLVDNLGHAFTRKVLFEDIFSVLG
jgi:3-dehydroquinate synthase